MLLEVRVVTNLDCQWCFKEYKFNHSTRFTGEHHQIDTNFTTSYKQVVHSLNSRFILVACVVLPLNQPVMWINPIRAEVGILWHNYINAIAPKTLTPLSPGHLLPLYWRCISFHYIIGYAHIYYKRMNICHVILRGKINVCLQGESIHPDFVSDIRGFTPESEFKWEKLQKKSSWCNKKWRVDIKYHFSGLLLLCFQWQLRYGWYIFRWLDCCLCHPVRNWYREFSHL